MDKRHGPPALILASGSKARQEMLGSAGLDFYAVPAAVDESALLKELTGKLPPQDIALALAKEKAKSVAAKNPGALVIGGDQILVFEGKIFTKPKNREEALANLQGFSGHTHVLVSAVVAVRDGVVLWRTVEEARLKMKALSTESLAAYLDAAGDAALRTVGSYELEGAGSWLFEKIEGDYFTVLGMPLLPLLSFLQSHGFGPMAAEAGGAA